MKKKIFTLLFILFMFENSYAIKTYDRFYLNLIGAIGTGLGQEEVVVATTTNDDEVKLSGGGGYGGGIGLGYAMNRKFDIDLNVLAQQSQGDISSDATFERAMALITLKYKFRLSRTQQFKIGLGAGIYSNSKMELEFDSTTTTIKYDDAIGGHFLLEYEKFFNRNWAFNIGLKYYMVEYKAYSYINKGSVESTNNLKDEMKEYNGNGSDVTIGITKYF